MDRRRGLINRRKRVENIKMPEGNVKEEMKINIKEVKKLLSGKIN